MDMTPYHQFEIITSMYQFKMLAVATYWNCKTAKIILSLNGSNQLSKWCHSLNSYNGVDLENIVSDSFAFSLLSFVLIWCVIVVE